MLNKSVLALLLFCNGLLLTSSQNTTYKCQPFKGDTYAYLCDAQFGEFNITAEFEYLSQTLPENGKTFKRLEIHNTNITEIPENAFKDISFNYIEIFEAQDLNRIHSNAFNNITITNLRQQLFISSPNQLQSYPEDGYDLFKAVSSLVNAVDLEFSLDIDSTTNEIPDNAFSTQQNSLMFFQLGNEPYSITRIGNNAFSGLNALTALSFRGVQIGNISVNAFDFVNPSTTTLTLNFEGCKLTDNSIADGAFANAQRPLDIYLNSNSLTLLREEKYGPFLRSNPLNQFELYSTPLDCSDATPYQWLLINKDLYQNRIQGAVCSDGRSIWNLPIDSNSTQPIPDDIYCKPNGNYMDCDANGQTLNITKEMTYWSENLSANQKHFSLLDIKNAIVTEIPENAFLDIAFDFIEILSSQNLQRVHTRAFNNLTVTYLVKQFYLSTPNQLISQPPDYDLWAALSSLTNVADIELSFAAGSVEIPDNAFGQMNPQNNLQFIAFDESSFEISRIGNNAFATLGKLSSVGFHDIPIGSIAAQAFDFTSNSDQGLRLTFIKCNLDETSFDDNVFSNAKRPLSIDLTNNNIKLIQQKTFGGFLEANNQNQIILNNNALDCSDVTQYQWLFNKIDSYKSQVLGAQCLNGTLLWDLDTTGKPNAANSFTNIYQILIVTLIFAIISRYL